MSVVTYAMIVVTEYILDHRRGWMKERRHGVVVDVGVYGARCIVWLMWMWEVTTMLLSDLVVLWFATLKLEPS